MRKEKRQRLKAGGFLGHLNGPAKARALIRTCEIAKIAMIAKIAEIWKPQIAPRKVEGEEMDRVIGDVAVLRLYVECMASCR